MTPRAMRPWRLMLGWKNRLTRPIYHRDFAWQAARDCGTVAHGFGTFGFEPALGLGALGRRRRRLFDLWLATKSIRAVHRRRGDVAGVFSAGPADDDHFHRDHGGGL